MTAAALSAKLLSSLWNGHFLVLSVFSHKVGILTPASHGLFYKRKIYICIFLPKSLATVLRTKQIQNGTKL